MALVLSLHRKSCRVASSDDLPLGRWNTQPQGSPQALDAPLANWPPFLPKQGCDAAIAVSGVLVTKFDHPLEQPSLPRGLLLWTIPVAGSRHFQDPTDLPARSQSLLHCFECVCPATGRAQSFFSHTNLRTRFSSRLSASIFLSSVFSRSSSFSRFASFTSICPNCFFHLWKLTSERLCSRHTSPMLWAASACLRIRILSSVLYRFPFMVFGLGCPKD